MKYVPSVAGAMASVLCRSKYIALGEVMSIASGWEDTAAQRRGHLPSTVEDTNIHVDENTLSVEELGSLLEKRLRLVISVEFKDAKKVTERNKLREERHEAASKRRDFNSSGIGSDSFESDSGGSSNDLSVLEPARGTSCTVSFSEDFGSPTKHRRRRKNTVSSREEPMIRKNGSCRSSFDSSSHDCSRFCGSRKSCDSHTPSPFIRKSPNRAIARDTDTVHTGGRSRIEKSDDEFADGYESSPGLSHRRLHDKNSASVAQQPKIFSHEHSLHLEFESDESSRFDHNHNATKPANKSSDDVFSDSEWSSQYGDVVPGHLFC